MYLNCGSGGRRHMGYEINRNMRCIWIQYQEDFFQCHIDKQEHEMYLNTNICIISGTPLSDKQEHEMYLNDRSNNSFSSFPMINRNMRCIWIRDNRKSWKALSDKQEHEMYLNYNIWYVTSKGLVINRNMRCIWIFEIIQHRFAKCDKQEHEMYLNNMQNSFSRAFIW